MQASGEATARQIADAMPHIVWTQNADGALACDDGFTCVGALGTIYDGA